MLTPPCYLNVYKHSYVTETNEENNLETLMLS